MELYPYFMGPGNLPTMIRKVNGREGRKRRRSCKVRTVISHIEQERHFGLRPTCLSCQSKSGQFICSKSGQIYLLTTTKKAAPPPIPPWGQNSKLFPKKWGQQ